MPQSEKPISYFGLLKTISEWVTILPSELTSKLRTFWSKEKKLSSLSGILQAKTGSEQSLPITTEAQRESFLLIQSQTEILFTIWKIGSALLKKIHKHRSAR
jgi:hypothetical protein